MAEISSDAGHVRQRGFAHPKKLSTRVDPTPMVDLGFLLLTFFIFSSKLSEPTAMKLFLPADGPPTYAGESSSLSIIPLRNNKLAFYHGSFEEAVKSGSYFYSNYSMKNGIGDIIRTKQQMLGEKRKDLMLIIKPSQGSVYKNVVDLLDEVAINGVSHYAIVDVSNEEKKLFNAY